MDKIQRVKQMIDILGYVKEQLKLVIREVRMSSKCIKCNEPLERIYYKINGLLGKFCRKCAHDLYNNGGYPFYLVDSEDEDNDEKEQN